MRESGKLKIVHLSSVHKPNDTRVFHLECKSLVAAGYQVTLVATHPEDELIDGVQIRALERGSGAMLYRLTLTMAQLVRLALGERGDLYHLHDPELIPAGLFLKLLGKRVMYDSHEDFGEQLKNKKWLPTVVRSSIGFAWGFIHQVYPRIFDGIVAATPPIAATFPSDKVTIVQNFPAISERTESAPPFAQRRNQAVYIGNIAKIRGLVGMIEAIALVDEKFDARLVLGGQMSDELLEEVKRLPGWARVDYRGWVDREEVATILGESKVGMCVLHPTSNYLVSQPVKLYEYMQAGIPSIASDFPVWRKIADGSGIMVDPMDSTEIAKQLEWIFSHSEESEKMGAEGRALVEKNYQWANEFAKMNATYKKILS